MTDEELTPPPEPGSPGDPTSQTPERVVGLLASGLSVSAVAAKLKVGIPEVLAQVRAAAEAESWVPKDVRRTIELAHLDMLRRALLPSVLRQGDPQSTYAALKVSEARALLLGITGPEGWGEEQPDELDRIRARRAARRAENGGA
ncbi:hypothetical protein AB3X52_04585 [Nocardioides sp. DS6]|uniref:Uncharacterized protein n=1 Tax=Nocardioides eburneus TaxID=3231482 RepID=A0ABV3SWR2_9ACTN